MSGAVPCTMEAPVVRLLFSPHTSPCSQMVSELSASCHHCPGCYCEKSEKGTGVCANASSICRLRARSPAALQHYCTVYMVCDRAVAREHHGVIADAATAAAAPKSRFLFICSSLLGRETHAGHHSRHSCLAQQEHGRHGRHGRHGGIRYIPRFEV